MFFFNYHTLSDKLDSNENFLNFPSSIATHGIICRNPTNFSLLPKKLKFSIGMRLDVKTNGVSKTA